VHVNRFPLDGKVLSVRHVPGGHIPAFDKESDRNERVETLLDTGLGRVKVVQIAGTVARRIVPYIKGGEPAAKGARMGLIRFGSRCDLYLPAGRARWTVRLGQQVHAATTQVAEAEVAR
jgi:phosphatidylserine decarboxylase